MILTASMQAVWNGVGYALDALAAASAQPASDTGGGINTEGVVSFLASTIAPILLAVLGVIFIGRASKGEISRVLTSSAIAIVGLAFIAGATVLFLVGDNIIRLLFK